MKKSYLMIAAVAALFAACSDNDTFKEVINNNEGSEIIFSTYAQKATRAENSDTTYAWSLSDHHLSFRVWGYKNTSDVAVFEEDSVGFTTSWSYVNKRYWDKAATTYEFYAFAPYNAPFEFNGVNGIASQKNGYFTITSAYNKAGENVSPKNSTDPVNIWKNYAETDVDLMIADTCRLSGAALKTAQDGYVTLNFIHILSRLNITVKTVTGFNPNVPEDDSIKVTKITISNMAHAGTFDETQGSVNANALQAGTTARWDTSSVSDYEYPINYKATLDANYVIEALMIPQQVLSDTISLDGTFPTGADEDAPYIKIEYSIFSYNKENQTKTAKQDYVAYYNLAKIFKVEKDDYLSFNEGWQNTLNITISPAEIKFDAKVAPWVEQNNEDLIIY